MNKGNYQIDWERLAKYNSVFVHIKRDPMEDVVKNDELVSWMKEYPDAMDAINLLNQPITVTPLLWC